MKKLINIFTILILSLVVISGCSCKKDEDNKANLLIGDMNATTYKTITISYLDTLIEDKESFLLYVYSPTCGGCNAFKPIIESVISEKHITVYAIDEKNINEDHELVGLKTTPALAVYKNGEILYKTKSLNNPEYFETKDGLVKFLNEYTNMPTAYYINLSQLDEKIANKENFVVYFSRNNCGDCKYLNAHYFKEYLNNNTGKKHFYIVETNVRGIRLDENDEVDSSMWQAFKDKYGLSNANNSLGHGVGYVPTMQYYQDGVITDMLVYFNDFTVNEDGTYTINNSYYDDNPYLNQTINSGEYKETLAPFYNQKVKSFLDTNLAKVD